MTMRDPERLGTGWGPDGFAGGGLPEVGAHRGCGVTPRIASLPRQTNMKVSGGLTPEIFKISHSLRLG